MQNIADTMAYLQGEGRLLRAEHNHLCEAFLVMASSAGYFGFCTFSDICLTLCYCDIVNVGSIICLDLLPYL